MANRQPIRSLLAQVLLCFIILAFAQNESPGTFQYVDPLIGTINGGHVFPGASLPFGMAKSVADTNSDDAQGGYASDDSESKIHVLSQPPKALC